MEDGVRDFWDIFAAIIEAIKLKPNFTALLTAKNYTWTRESISIKSIQLSSYTFKKISNLEWSASVTVGDVMNALKTPEEIMEQKESSDLHSKSSQDAYPVIVRRTEEGKMQVMDGNRRTLRAALYGKSNIDAWVASADGGTIPRNHWVPVNDLMQIVKLFNLAKNDAQRQAVRDTLEVLFQASTVSRVTFDTRVLEIRGAEELIALDPSQVA